jgi:hypothetical protein
MVGEHGRLLAARVKGAQRRESVNAARREYSERAF